MITIKHGSIFDSTADVLVCPVNCVGVMGKGLALEFKRRWPEMYDTYRKWTFMCAISAGEVHIIDRVMIAATKEHWRNPSRIEWVDACLAAIAEAPPVSIALPQLGCGCGGLDWADVWPLYERHLGGLDADVEVWIWL